MQINTQYALVLSNTLGDVITFTSLSPHRVLVEGRVGHELDDMYGEWIG